MKTLATALLSLYISSIPFENRKPTKFPEFCSLDHCQGETHFWQKKYSEGNVHYQGQTHIYECYDGLPHERDTKINYIVITPNHGNKLILEDYNNDDIFEVISCGEEEAIEKAQDLLNLIKNSSAYWYRLE
tara:strand:+ start:1407 stop:1799 length:393 start_codon:yes stop_codon:yes gene_type:complete